MKPTNKTTEDKPTTVDEVDALQLEKLMLQAQNLDLQKQIVQTALQQTEAKLLDKYGIGPDDRIDLASRTISRK